jgi:hypothetical protein
MTYGHERTERDNAMTNDPKAPYVPPTLNKEQRLEEVVGGLGPTVTHGVAD